MLPDPDTLLAFIAASALVTVAPGPDNLMVLGHGMSRGREAGVAVALGCALGCITHTLWAALGVSALIATSETAFLVLKLLGGGYLIWLGVNVLRHAGQATVAVCKSSDPRGHGHYLRRGLIANAVNPKVALFFLAFLPQFAEPENGSVSRQILLLGALFAMQTALIFSTIAFFAAAVGSWLTARPGAGCWLDRASGLLFLGLGLKLALISGP
jgi:threonine/homoserine/homoserine lactone efflux protein